jgi:hypothetical protein
MPPNQEHSYTLERFVVVLQIIETSPITSQWMFFGSENQTPVSNIADADFSTTYEVATIALEYAKGLGDYPDAFVFPITTVVDIRHYSDWSNAYKLLQANKKGGSL